MATVRNCENVTLQTSQRKRDGKVMMKKTSDKKIEGTQAHVLEGRPAGQRGEWKFSNKSGAWIRGPQEIIEPVDTRGNWRNRIFDLQCVDAVG